MMNDEIFYLESTLYIEKAMDEVREASLGVCESAEDGFLFESAGNVFQKLKEKIINLMNKVKSLFTGKTMKKKDADAIAKSKNATGTIEVRDVKKLGKLQNDCMKDLNSGKDPEKVKKKWKKGLAILGFAVAGAAVAGGVAMGVNKHKKKMNVKQLPAVIKEADSVVADANKNMSKPLQLADKMSKEKISHRRAAKNGVILQGKSGSDGVIQQGMKTLGLPDKRKNDVADAAFQKDIASRISVASEIYSDTSKAAVAIKNDCYTSVSGGKTTKGESKHAANLINTMKTLEKHLATSKDRLQILERSAKLPRNKNHGKLFEKQIKDLKNQIAENEQRLEVVRKKAKRIQGSGDTYMAASASSDIINTATMIIERADELQRAIDIMNNRIDIVEERVHDMIGDNLISESSDELDVILGSSYMDDDLMLADESVDDLAFTQESYDDIFDDDDSILADESVDDYSDIFDDIDDVLGC